MAGANISEVGSRCSAPYTRTAFVSDGAPPDRVPDALLRGVRIGSTRVTGCGEPRPHGG